MEIIFGKGAAHVISDYEIAALLEGSPHRRYGLVKRALASGELIQVRRGLYAVAPGRSGQPLDLFSLADRIYGPSYISLESALAVHGLIPEAVLAVTSVTARRSTEFKTPLGIFSYVRIPQSGIFAGVERRTSAAGVSFVAEPLKALADYCYVHKKRWTSLAEASRDLRLDDEALAGWKVTQVNALIPVYGSRRVRTFLKSIRKEMVS
jgi:predicted transcriptional regulator of viral defense system